MDNQQVSPARFVWRRLRLKVIALIPVVVGALILVGVLSLVLPVVIPYLPDEYQHLIQLVQQGDWEASRVQFLQILNGFGASKRMVFVVIQIAQVVLAPIPAPLSGFLGGYLFGFWEGLALSMLGLTIGSLIAMALGRLLGVHVVRRFVPARLLKQFDEIISRGGVWTFLLIFLLPVMPDDAICFMAGLTKLPLWKLVLACVIGRLPGTAVLTFTGANVGSNNQLVQVVLVIALFAAVLLWLFSEEVEQWFALLTRQQRTHPAR